MAELNIDKSLIDHSNLIQSEEAMVGMQNGCICCTLQSDLVEQIVGLTQKKKFNHILIEASGVSEPHEIAPLFELDEHEHANPDEAAECEALAPGSHEQVQLGEVARLDTCVTLIDSADFYNNLSSMKTYDNCEVVGTIAELMMDQVEFANVIVLNKGDLVSEEQQADLTEKVTLLNSKAKIVKTTHSKIEMKDILNTGLYKDADEFWVTSTKNEAEAEKAEKEGRRVPEACTARFDIKSFVYRARKPFHPGRLCDLVLEPFFMAPAFSPDEEEGEVAEKTEEEKKKKTEEENRIELQRVQEEALVKQKRRTDTMGELLRSKGFMWIATSNDVIGAWQQAGNVLRIGAEDQWMCLMPEMWMGSSSEALVLQDIRKPNGEDYEYKDRRQEIVFIGHGMKGEVIQQLLDECLLTEEEMALGPEGWKETMEHLDKIKLELEEFEDEDEDEDEDGAEKEKCEDEKCDDAKCES